MKILIACEESQIVCKAFRAKGHEAFSCDLKECSGGHPEWHIQSDVIPLLSEKWDMIIAHPPCTHLSNSGSRWFAEKQKDFRQQKACVFFMYFALAPCEKIVIENPVGIMSTVYRKPDQIIQPWQFALDESENTMKSTCLWLKGVPKLQPINIEKPEIKYHTWIDKTGRVKRQSEWYYKTRCLEYEKRGTAASKTFIGIAAAMANQWG